MPAGKSKNSSRLKVRCRQINPISERAAQWRVETQYRDAFGQVRRAHREAVSRLVQLISAGEELPPRRLVAPTVVSRTGCPQRLRIDVAPDCAIRWELFGDESIVSGEGSASHIRLPGDLPVGTFRLRLKVGLPEGEHGEDATFVVAPARSFQGDNGPHRMWALAVQLYGVRSRRNWGHGDFTDLADLIQLAADWGAAGIALNPLHALFDDRADEASPYSPNSRLFLNPLYIDVEAVPDFPGLQAAGMAQAVQRLRQEGLVEYRGVAREKMRALNLSYDVFRRSGSGARQREFDAFRTDHAEDLSRFACFEWLRRHFKRQWREWPAEWRYPNDEALAALRSNNKGAIEFFEYLQWIAARQLDDCRVRARQLGLPIGLYLDIAVGVRPEGFDAWNNQDSILPDVTIGAPPDLLNLAGQNWGLAGINPNGWERRALEPFRCVLRASMRHAGAVRLDHVLGLERLYLIPHGMPSGKGAYVRFPLEALLAVTAQESVQHKCIVIGEDLGTVPENLRQQLADWGIWSYQVMLFERAPDGSFIAPEDYRENALVTFATHDLPTFRGWTEAHDLTIKASLCIDPGESREARSSALAAMRKALSARDIQSMDFLSVTKYLAATPSRLLVVTLEDALHVKDQVNVPGTINEHPNWRARLPVLLEDLKHQPSLVAVADIMIALGRNWC